MSDQDDIRKAAELADGWDWHTDEDGGWLGGPDMGWHEDIISQGAKDALAAQLARQVNALPRYRVSTHDGFSMVHEQTKPKHIGFCRGNESYMNTIKAILDSQTLEPKNG